MFWEKLFGADQHTETEKLPVVDVPEWEPIQLNEAGVSVDFEKIDGTVEHYDCTGVWESPTRYMLTWGEGGRKVHIGKENVNTIEVK